MASDRSSLRIFAVSAILTVATLIAVLFGLGWQALMIATLLIVIEITFSFENAIINARVLRNLSPFWQQIFLTVGVVIAIFGMRIIFPILIVAMTAHLEWRAVIDLALHHPEQYAEKLHHAHPSIAAFGGMFLLMLGLDFFFEKRTVHWIDAIEKPLQAIGRKWLAGLVSFVVLVLITALPGSDRATDIWIAGLSGIATYLAIHGISSLFGQSKQVAELSGGSIAKKTGIAAFMAFLYLEVLDASFSFDGVVGAFAITSDVILIAAGLGVGALWVRSLTIYMVRKGLLEEYRYLEHGAHYTILVLAAILLTGIFLEIPEASAGIIGILLIGYSVFSSMKANNHTRGAS